MITGDKNNAKYRLIFLSLIGVILVFLSTSRYGVGISPDSVAYLSSAKSLLSGSGYLLYNGQPLIDWPPLFPTLLATLGFIGISPIDGARMINAIVFGLIIFGSGQLLLGYLKSRILALCGVLFILLSPPLLTVSVMAWTEPLFILLAILFLIQLGKFLEHRWFGPLLLLAVISALACLQRYIGVIIIAAGFMAIIYPAPNVRLLRRLKQGLLFGIISGLPLVLWLVRNYLLASSLAGTRPPAEFTLLKNLILTGDTVTGWFLPQRIPLLARLSTAGLVATLFAVAFISLDKNERHSYIQRVQIWFIGAFVFLYSVFVVVGASFYAALGPIGERFLAPLYVFILFLLFIGADSAWQNLKHSGMNRKISLIFALVWLTAWLVLSVFRTSESVYKRMKNGAGVFTTTGWIKSPLLDSLRSKPLDGRIFSNAPDAIYILTGIAGQLSPSRYEVDPEKMKSMMVEGRSYVVWFEDVDRPHLYSRSELASRLVLEEIGRFTDGTIYLIKSPRQQ
jgi:4-amino-4-deoxy-L-arabinose transferase-like glycosyltransferase